MRLVQFSVQRYRSIIKAERLVLGDLTVLVGPNNEGKSNILQALVASMRALSVPVGPTVDRPLVRRRNQRLRGDYQWDRDFPRALQNSQPDGRSIFNLDFELSEDEIETFAARVGSKLNGNLPIGLSVGRTNRPQFAVRKQRHSASLSARQQEISQFIAEHVDLQYIPAARTHEHALEVVDEMLARELRVAEDTNTAYQRALAKIQEVQEPIIKALESALCGSLQRLLPEVQVVELEVEDRGRMNPRTRLTIDDGTATELEFKGDGVQSSLIRHAAEQRARASEFVLAVEEPEAHLHPRAIHEIASVLRATAETQQVVLSTHSPLLVNRFDLGSNIIVEKTRARAAESVRELRETLGVRTSDALDRAEVILLVEGFTDVEVVRALLADRSDALASGLVNGLVSVQPLHGSGKLGYTLTLLRDSLCQVHALLDNDPAGRDAGKKARDDGLLRPKDETYTSLLGAGDTELEDLLSSAAYRAAVESAFGLALDGFLALKLSKGKWSDRMRLAFTTAGKPWDENVLATIKSVVAKAATAHPATAVDPLAEALLSTLVLELEGKLETSQLA